MARGAFRVIGFVKRVARFFSLGRRESFLRSAATELRGVRKVARAKGRIAVFAATCAGFLSGAAAHADPPAANLVSASPVLPQTSYYGSNTTHTDGVAAWRNAQGQVVPAPEITALARTLGSERLAQGEITAVQFSQNVFDYVRNNIDVEFRYGLGKGARGALIDQSGTPFDQAELMVRLLRAGGATATYQLGTIELNDQDFGRWTGLIVWNPDPQSQTFAVDARAACQLLADGGIPTTLGGGNCASLSGNLSTVMLSHIWVSANGLAYDPSFKIHALARGIDVPEAMDCGNETSSACGTDLVDAAMHQATQGVEVGSGIAYIQNVNEGAINTQLQSAAVHLQNEIQSTNRLAVLEEIVGGARLGITPTPPLVASHPYVAGTPTTIAGDIPDQYRTRLRVRFSSLEQTFYADEVAGRRLQLFGSANGGGMTISDQIVLDGGVASTAACTPPQDCTSVVRLNVNHPYAASSGAYADDEFDMANLWQEECGGTTPCAGTYPVTVILGLGAAGASTERHYSSLQEARPQTAIAGWEAGMTLTVTSFRNEDQPILAAKLLSQGALADRIVSGVADAAITRHHDFGILYAHSARPATLSQMTVQSAVSVNPNQVDPVRRAAAFETSAATWAVLEGSVNQQANNTSTGVSTATGFWSDDQSGRKFLQLTSAQLQNSLPSTIPNTGGEYRQRLSDSGAAGYGAILPEDGGVEIFTRANSTAYTRSAAVKGGSAFDNNPISRAIDTTKINETAADRRRYMSISPADGAATITAVDMVTGSGEFPAALPFQRTYRSDVAIADDVLVSTTYSENLSTFAGQTSNNFAYRYSGPDTSANARLGSGWSHNWNVSAAYTGNGRKGFGADYAIEATFAIATLRSIYDASRNPTFSARLAGVFAEYWLAKNLAYNSVTIDKGGPTETFQRLADGSFLIPRGDARLVQSGQPTLALDFSPVTFDYTGRNGDMIHFDWAVRSVHPRSASWTAVKAEPVFKATTWTFPDGTEIYFEYVGQFMATSWSDLVQPMCNTDGCNFSIIAHLPFGYVLQRVANNRGRSLTFQWTITQVQVCCDAPGVVVSVPSSFRIMRVTDENDRHVDYAVSNCNGRRFACDTFTVTDPTSAVTRYEYTPDDNSPNPPVIVRPTYRLRRIFTPELTTGAYETVRYDELFRVRRVTDAQGHATNYFPGAVSGGEIWRRGEVQSPLSTAATPVVTTSIFDDDNSALSVTNSLGHTTRNEYDRAHRLTSTINPEGDEIERTYDVRSNQTDERRISKTPGTPASIVRHWEFPEEGTTTCVNWRTCNKPLWESDGRNFATRYTWNSTTGLITRIEQGLDAAFNCAVLDPYDPDYPNAASTDKVCPQIDFTYTAFGSGSQFWLPTGRTERIRGPAGSPTMLVTNYEYDTGNKYVLLRGIVDPSGLNLRTTFGFDGIGNVTQIDGPRTDAADMMNVAWDANRRIKMRIESDPDGTGGNPRQAVRLTYNAGGLLTASDRGTTTAAPGSSVAQYESSFAVAETTTYLLDNAGQRTRATRQAGAAVLGVTQFSYDAEGRRECTAVRMNPDVYEDAEDLPPHACWLSTQQGDFGPDRITRLWYDRAGQVVAEQRAVGTADQQSYAVYTYTPNGKRWTVTDANSNRSTFHYDGHDRLFRLRFPIPAVGQNASSWTDYEEYTYDANDNRITFRVRSGETIAYQYDALNRQFVKDIPNGTSADVTSAYDLLGRRLYARFGAGAASAGCSVSSQGVDSCYDKAGRLLFENGYGRKLIYEVDAAGNRTRLTWPNETNRVDYTFDAMNRMDQVRENGATSGVGALADYVYDARGRRDGIVRAGVQGGAAQGAPSNYDYDAASRLIKLEQILDAPNNLTLDFAYNPASQVTSRSVSEAYRYAAQALSRTYDRNGLNQYTAVSGVSYEHDARGNLIFDGARRFCYDVENRLTGVAGAAGNACTTPTFSLSYDPLGRLRETNAAGTVTPFLYDGDRLVAEYASASPTALPLRRYVHGAGVDEPIVFYQGDALNDTTRRWLHADHQGSIVAASDGSGALSGSRYAYGPYGEPDNQNAWLGQRFRYTGQIALPEAQLYHYKARAYDPGLGRFLQTDPVGYEDDLNLYTYVANDPLNKTDPTGMICERQRQSKIGSAESTASPAAQSEFCQALLRTGQEGRLLHPSPATPNSPTNTTARPNGARFVPFGRNGPGAAEAAIRAVGIRGAADANNISQRVARETHARRPEGRTEGRGDAWRHANWSAALTQRFGAGAAREIANGHERDNLSGGGRVAGSNQDLFNNYQGRTAAELLPGFTAQGIAEGLLNEGYLQEQPFQ